MLDAFEFAMEMAEMDLVNEFGNTPKGQRLLYRTGVRAIRTRKNLTDEKGRLSAELTNRARKGDFKSPRTRALRKEYETIGRRNDKAFRTERRVQSRISRDNGQDMYDYIKYNP